MERKQLLEQHEILCNDLGRLRAAQAVLCNLIESTVPTALEAIDAEIQRLTNLKTSVREKLDEYSIRMGQTYVRPVFPADPDDL